MTQSLAKVPRGRVYLLDEMRGLCILLMVLYHGAYDIVYVFGTDIPAFHWPVVTWAQPVVAGVFVLLSGMACRFSRNNTKRGLIALALGLGMSLVTWKLFPDNVILFGILHFMGTAMMLFAAARPLLDRIPPWLGFGVFLALFFVTWGVPARWIGFLDWRLSLPASWYRTGWLFLLGLCGDGFVSADYFPLFPWLMLFLAGSYLGIWFVRDRAPGFFYLRRSSFLALIGRRTIYVYLLHQPVLYGLLWVIYRLAGKI